MTATISVDALNHLTRTEPAPGGASGALSVDFQALIEDADDGILVTADTGKFVYANRKAAEITGFTIADLVNIGFHDLAHPSEMDKLQDRYARRLRGESIPSPYETRIVRKNGTVLPIEVSGARTTWMGRPAIIAVIRDISGRKQAEQTLRNTQTTLENMLHRRTQELEIKSRNFEERSRALKSFLKRKEMEKLEVQEQLLHNVKQIVEPYLERIRSHLD